MLRPVNPLLTLSASELARRIRAREVSPVEAVEAHLERIEAVNPLLNAVVVPRFNEARREAKWAEEVLDRTPPGALPPLFGLPITVKECFAVAGMPWTGAVLARRGVVAREDATVVRRLRDAGAVVLGLTNTSEGLIWCESRNPVYGRTRNPRDLGRTPGGSSGGEAAILAAGGSALGIGSDVGGSIRVPAHACGVVGLRPTEGFLPAIGHARVPGLGPLRSLAAVGPMARSVDDLSLLLSVLSSQPEPPAPPPRPDQLRLGWCAQWGEPAPSQAVRAVLERLRERLSAAGVELQARPLAPGLEAGEAWRLWGLIHGHEVRTAHPLPLRAAPLGWLAAWLVYRLRFGPSAMTRQVARGWRAGEQAYQRARGAREALTAAFEEQLAGLDALLMPAWPLTAPPHQRTGAPVTIDGRAWPYADALGAYQCPTVLLGCPALALPAGLAADGLPVGVQLLAPRGHDWRLLQVARAVEEARGPWSGLAPLEV